MTGGEERPKDTDKTKRTHDEPTQRRESKSNTVDLTGDDDDSYDGSAPTPRVAPPGPFKPPGPVAVRTASRLPPKAPAPEPRMQSYASVRITGTTTHHTAPPGTLALHTRTIAGETSPAMSGHSTAEPFKIQPTDPSTKPGARPPPQKAAASAPAPKAAVKKTNLGVNPARRMFSSAVTSAHKPAAPKPKPQSSGQPASRALADRLHTRETHAPRASTSRAPDDAEADERRRASATERDEAEAEEQRRRASEDEGRSRVLAAKMQREEDAKAKRASRSSAAVKVSVKGAAAGQDTKKAKGKERAAPPPPPAAADGGPPSPAKPKTKLVRGRKEKKPIEVLELVSSDEEDDIEDADAPALRRTTPPDSRNDKGKGKATSHYFKHDEDQPHASSDDPMALMPAAPHFNLTDGAGASGSGANGHVKNMANAIEKKEKDKEKEKVVSRLKPRQSTQQPLPLPPPPTGKKRAANNDDEEAFVPATKGSDKATKKPRTGPAPSYDVLSVPATKPADVVFCLASFFIGDNHFPQLTRFPASSNLTLSLYTANAPGKYTTDRLVLEVARKAVAGGETPGKSQVVTIQPEHIHSILWPSNFVNGTAPILVFELRDSAKEVIETLRQNTGNPAEIDVESEPNVLTVRLKPVPEGSQASKDLTKVMVKFQETIQLRWKNVTKGSISGVGGAEKIKDFDKQLEKHYTKPPKLKAASTSNSPNIQTQIIFPPPVKKTDKPAEPAPRRSKRDTTSALRTRPDDAEDLTPVHPFDDTPADKVVLIWPHEGVGAVSVTHGDKQRLRPEEFLNDTLIELGLKRAFDHLSATKPEVADKVHMFNSFFYKKLSARKTQKEDSSWTAYSTVRKWTQKFDLFKKKYIVVPINEHLHWYLAIIVNPGAILAPPTKRVTRASMGGAAAATEVVIDDDGDGDGEQAALTQKFQTAVSLTEGGEEPSDMVVDDEGNVKPAPDTNVTAGPTRDGSPELVGDEAAEAGAKAEKEDSDMDMLDSDDEAKASLGIVPDSQVDPPPPPPPPAPVARFPIKPTPFGPSQEPPKSKAAQVEPEPEPSAPSVLVEDQVVTDATLAQQLSDASKDETKCYIFTFDSLGGGHKTPTRKLKEYLRDEALDKNKSLKATDISYDENVVMMTAEVPQQDNFCDCGLFLLHYVEHFLNNPDVMLREILTQAKPPKKTDVAAMVPYNEKLYAIWNAPAAIEKRVTMRKAVDEMCAAWAEFRAPYEEIEELERVEKRKKKAEKAAADKAKADEELAILKRADDEERKIEAEKRAEAKKLELAQQSEHEQKIASLANGREAHAPISLDKPPKHARAPPSKAAEDRAAAAAAAAAAPAPKMENEDSLDFTNDDDEDEDDSPPKAKPVAAPEAPTSKSGRILPPPNANPPKDAPRSTRNSRQASPVASPSTPRQTTPVAGPETLVLSPDNKSSTNGRRKRDDAADASSGSPPKAKKLRQTFTVEVPATNGRTSNGSAPPSPAVAGGPNGFAAPSRHSSPAQGKHTRFPQLSPGPSAAPASSNVATSGGSTKENRDGTPAKSSAALDLTSAGAPAQNDDEDDDDMIIEDAPSSKVASTRAATASKAGSGPVPILPGTGKSKYDWETPRPAD